MRIDAYLRGHDVARRRFQLADRLARIYTQYLVYRPDWLQAWAAGRDPVGDAGFHLPLWRELRARIGVPHRGERLARLLAAFVDGPIPHDDEPLHVFGISHLAPSELALLRAVAKQRLVVLYVPDPCREFWGGLRGERSRLRELVAQDADGLANETVFLEHGHPLLASWGRLGQHFLLALDDSEAAIDERHYLDKPEAAIEPANRLQRVQESIRRAEPALIASSEQPAAQRIDRSLRIHACHTRLRELEVLRDALLRELDERPGLKPSDIVVMAPNIQAITPLLPAVFGEAGVRRPWPAVLSPRGCRGSRTRIRCTPRSHACSTCRDRARPRPKSTTCSACRRSRDRFGLSAMRMSRRSPVGCAIGACPLGARCRSFRAHFEVPQIAEHSFAWGMDRMLAEGYAMGAAGDGDDQVRVAWLPDGGRDRAAGRYRRAAGRGAGRARRSAGRIRALVRARARTRMRASAWTVLFEKRFDAAFRIDPMDTSACEAGSQLRRAIRGLADEPAQCGLDPELEFDVVREVGCAERHRRDVSERQPSPRRRRDLLRHGAAARDPVPRDRLARPRRRRFSARRRRRRARPDEFGTGAWAIATCATTTDICSCRP